MLAARGGLALACDNNAAIEIVGDTYRVITSARGARAYKVFRSKGEVVAERLPTRKAYAPLEHLLTRTESGRSSKG